MSDALPSSLAQLARAHGVQTSYLDMHGATQHASPESLLAVLRVLGAAADGAPLDSPDDARAALRAWQRNYCNTPLEPVTALWEGDPARVMLRLPEGEAGAELEYLVVSREGEPLQGRATPGAPEGKPHKLGKTSYVTVPLTLTRPLALGYHDLHITTASGAHATRIIHAPRKAYQSSRKIDRRAWGAFLPLYALRTARDLGTGDLTDLEALLDFVQSQGGGAISTLPLLAAFLGETGPTSEPFEYSPYTPASRLFWNELYVDPARAPEFPNSTPARGLMESADFEAERAALSAEPLVDYRRAMALRRRVLEPLAQHFFATVSGARHAQFEAFRAMCPALEDYACFRATCERQGAPWPAWPEVLRAGAIRADAYDPAAAQYHMYVQFLAHEQLTALSTRARERGPGLYLDMPLGVHHDSYDVWRERTSFALGMAGGAPPDAFFAGGQNWGFPPLHPHESRRTGHRYLIRVFRQLMRHSGMLRIDHAMGLHRLFWVPAGMGARQGVYVNYPAEELYAILCLESHRHKTMLAGEDLGTVPPVVRTSMSRHELRRLYVMQFEIRPDPAAAVQPATRKFVAGLNTHDMGTFGAFWLGKDLDRAVELKLLPQELAQIERAQRWKCQDALVAYLQAQGLIGLSPPTETILAACLKLLASSPSPLMLVNLEDLWLEMQPQNTPGTWREVPNWRLKAAKTLEEFSQMPQVTELLREIDRRRRTRIAKSEAPEENTEEECP